MSTPRTDELWAELMNAAKKCGIAPANIEAFKTLEGFRQLETELQAATRERDEALEVLARVNRVSDSISEQIAVEQRKRLVEKDKANEAERERDALRAELAELRKDKAKMPAFLCNVASRVAWLRGEIKSGKIPQELVGLLSKYTAPVPFESELLSGSIEQVNAAIDTAMKGAE